MENEDPFGIGFASVAFAAKRIEVESRGKAIRFDHHDLVAKTPIAIVKSDFIGGTRVTLHDIAFKGIKAKLEEFAMGFPIPVYLGGKALPRPHALESLQNVQDTPVGKIHIAALDAKGRAQIAPHGRVYCQGLPVATDFFTATGYWNRRDENIVHIDHRQWKPRVPDRDTLIDARQACEAIHESIKALWVARMERDKPVMPPEAFVERYWAMAADLQRLDIMNDVPVLPNCALTVVGDYPVDPAFGSNVENRQGAPVTREQVERGELTLCTPIEVCLEGDNFARLMLVMEKQWVIVGSLPPGHWATPHVIDMDALPVRVGCKVLATGGFAGGWTAGTVKAVEDLRLVFELNGKREAVDIADPIALGRDSWNVSYLVPKGSAYPAKVLQQASSYLNDSENYEETSHNLDIDEFSNLCATLFGEAPAATLHKCLVAGHVFDRTTVRGKRFVVNIDEDGKPSVEEASDGTA